MKKLLSILCALTLLTANSQMAKINAVDNSSMPVKQNNISIVKNTDLSALASSLGSDTDCFNFSNYGVESVSDYVSQEFDSQRNQYEKMLTPIDLVVRSTINPLNTSTITNGVDTGMSVLQILVHNGVISASDIQAGAETLKDITLNDNVNDILTYYQMTQLQTQKPTFARKNFYCNNNTAGQCQSLIETAQRSMEQNKYFYISFQKSWSALSPNSMVGIGIADGSWTYNNKTYDKCILTLDSNSDTSQIGFKEESCIFINSETNEFYIPNYEAGSEAGAFISFVTDDETLLNYRGLINPSQTIETDTSKMKNIYIRNSKKCEFDLTVIDESSSETYHGTYDNPLSITENSWGNNTYCIENGQTFKVDIGATAEYDINSNEFEMNIYNENGTYGLTSRGKGEYSAEISDNKVNLINKSIEFTGNEDERCSLEVTLNEGAYNSSPYAHFTITDIYPENLTLENTEDGIIVSDSNGLAGYISADRFLIDEEGNLHFGDDYVGQFEGDCGSVFATNQTFRLTGGVNSVLIKYNEEIDRLQIWFDKDEDGVYESPIEKGDANTDGVINASDASMILSAYAHLSSGGVDFGLNWNPYICDYNGDNQLNAADASAVLAYYAEMSSGDSN